MTSAPAPLRLAGLCGSLRSGSLNAAVLATAARLAGPRAVLTVHPDLGRLPFFNHDVEMAGCPPQVVAFRELVGAADGVLVASPEYAHGTSGVLKNALEWLVGSGGVVNKPVAVVTASPSMTGGDRAQAWVRETLEVMDAVLLPPLLIQRASARIRDNAVHEPEALEGLRSLVDALTDAAGKMAADEHF
ncbi:NADPH-dependent FMN reductase [Streptantibioticus silvisoli]|uniref:NADPH-dependent FMN reductase n=1 Tax=Streptantibioticus silvisoli TaxID=2705255 RepID=A0ABT6W2B8_9ACTN|nr:NADPH-dependent FMN reductase [Streptantibioticus silvisoli]MDI5964891.1 NADPH-dependent FMN reductase [Streptantibioticus silvisoli]